MLLLRLLTFPSILIVLLSSTSFAASADNVINANAGSILTLESYGTFDEPWAMTFLPGGDLLVTEKKRHLTPGRSG